MTGSPISFAFVDGRPLFMDLEEDLYFVLEPECEQVFIGWCRAGMNSAELPNELGELVRSGMLPIGPLERTRPLTSALSVEAGSSSLREIASAWMLIVGLRLALKRQPLGLLLGELTRRPRGPDSSPDKTERLAARFAAARLFAPVSGNCLSDSLALLSWLGRHGESATLVFGAKLDPFAAHCWVEAAGILLNDHPDRVERFTPVRAVECGRALH